MRKHGIGKIKNADEALSQHKKTELKNSTNSSIEIVLKTSPTNQAGIIEGKPNFNNYEIGKTKEKSEGKPTFVAKKDGIFSGETEFPIDIETKGNPEFTATKDGDEYIITPKTEFPIDIETKGNPEFTAKKDGDEYIITPKE